MRASTSSRRFELPSPCYVVGVETEAIILFDLFHHCVPDSLLLSQCVRVCWCAGVCAGVCVCVTPSFAIV